MKHTPLWLLGLTAAAAATAASSTTSMAAAETRTASVILSEDASIQGDPIGFLASPFVSPDGALVFTGAFGTSNPLTGFVWIDGVPNIVGTDLPGLTAFGGQTAGVSAAGGYAFEGKNAAGEEAVFIRPDAESTPRIYARGDVAPDLPGDWLQTVGRPRMTASGQAWFESFVENEPPPVGGPQDKVLFRVQPDGTVTAMLREGNSVPLLGGGFETLADGNFAGISEDNAPSPNGRHWVSRVHFWVELGAPTEMGIVVDGLVRHRDGWAIEGHEPATWGIFTGVDVNSAGTYVFGGEYGYGTGDWCVAVDGVPIACGGETVGDAVIPADAFPRQVRITEDGRIVQAWAGDDFHQFVMTPRADAPEQSVVLLASGDQLDVDGDGVADYVFDPSSPYTWGTFDVSDDAVYANLELQPIDAPGTDIEMILRLDLPPVTCAADVDGDGSVGLIDLLTVLGSWGPCAGCPADVDGDDAVGFGDLTAVLGNWGACSTG